MAKLSTLVDDFNSASLNTTQWTVSAGVSQRAGKLSIPMNLNLGANNFDGVWSISTFDFKDSQLSAQFTFVPGTVGTERVVYFEVDLAPHDGTNRLGIEVFKGNLGFRANLGGNFTMTQIGYHTPTHLWWRIRETSGVFLWETSQDGIVWVSHRNITHTLSNTTLAAARGQITGAYWNTQPPVDAIQVNNINTRPDTTAVSSVTDSFPSTTGLNTATWDSTVGSPTTSAGKALLPCVTNADSAGWTALSTRRDFTLQNSQFSLEAGVPLNWGSRILAMRLVVPSNDNRVSLYNDGNQLVCRSVYNGGVSDTSIARSATEHRWWRIREASGTMYWETSPDGLSWTVRRSLAHSFTAGMLATAKPEISCGTVNAEPAASAAIDNVNITPPTVQAGTHTTTLGLTNGASQRSAGRNFGTATAPLALSAQAIPPPVFTTSLGLTGQASQSLHTSALSDPAWASPLGLSGTAVAGTGYVPRQGAGPVRFHYYQPVTDQAGNLYPWAEVRVYADDGQTPYPGTLYRDSNSDQTFTQPIVAAPGLIEFYTDRPDRIVLGIATSDYSQRRSPVRAIPADADETVTTEEPVSIEGGPVTGALLRARGNGRAGWHLTQLGDHTHAGREPEATRLGRTRDASLAQSGGFAGSTVLGAESGGAGSATSLRYTTMLGVDAEAFGAESVALGADSYAPDAGPPGFSSQAVAAAPRTQARARGVALGRGAQTWILSAETARSDSVALGRDAQDGGAQSLSIGTLAHAGQRGIALGALTGSASHGPPGSIGLGAGAQYGLPSDTTHPAVLLGAYEASTARAEWPWNNPYGSLSESWRDDDIGPEMAFTGRSIQTQRGLQWSSSGTLSVAAAATVAGRGRTLGFYGATPIPQPRVGADEVCSGLSALDSLVYALRDMGLLAQRNPATAIYAGSDLARRYLPGDAVLDWREQWARNHAVTSGIHPPSLITEAAENNYATAARFDNIALDPLLNQVQTTDPQPRTTHAAIVARHTGPRFGDHEGALNLIRRDHRSDPATKLLSAARFGATSWDLGGVSFYTRDGLDQTANADARLDEDAHVYTVTTSTEGPIAAYGVIGGPREPGDASPWQGWHGSILAAYNLDETWQRSDVQSLAKGLAFQYHIGQSDALWRDAARGFLLNQQDPPQSVQITLDQPYPDEPGLLAGRITGLANYPIAPWPWITLFPNMGDFSHSGRMAGQWGGLWDPQWWNYEVQLFVLPDTELTSSQEPNPNYIVGYFSLNANGTWSTGNFEVRQGVKIARIVRRGDHVLQATTSGHRDHIRNTVVQVGIREADGTFLITDGVPVWGDYTWFGTTRHYAWGGVRAELREFGSNTFIASTDRSLPRSWVVPGGTASDQNAGTLRDAALSALAWLHLDTSDHFRAQAILRVLARLYDEHGQLVNTYQVPDDPSADPVPDSTVSSTESLAWVALAALTYGQITGQDQFQPLAEDLADELLLRQTAEGSLIQAPGQTMAPTVDAALGYFLFRDLGLHTGQSEYLDAAEECSTALSTVHWRTFVDGSGYFAHAAADDTASLRAQALGGLWALARRDGDKARRTLRYLRWLRVKNQQVASADYGGATRLMGYRPWAQTTASPPPAATESIDHAGTWMTLLMKMRAGEPVGDDLDSLARWRSVTGTDSGSGWGRFLDTSASTATAAPGLLARPRTEVAAWIILAAAGGHHFLLGDHDPAAAPTPTMLTLTAEHLQWNRVFAFTVGWQLDSEIDAAAWEAVPEMSSDGLSWIPATTTRLGGPLYLHDDGSGGFSAEYRVQDYRPDLARYHRVRVRVRNVPWGAYAVSPTVEITPPI